MWKDKQVTFTFMLLSVTEILVSCHSDLPIRSFRKKVSEELGELLTISDKSEDLLFGTCIVKNYGDMTNFTCTITSETPVSEPSNFSQKVCNISISKRLQGDVSFWNIRSLNDNNVLLRGDIEKKSNNESDTIIWNDLSTVMMNVIRMTDCSVFEVSFVPENILIFYDGDIVNDVNEDFFDLFYTMRDDKTLTANYTKPDCQNYICRIRYSLEGKTIEGPTELVKKPKKNSQILWQSFTSNLAYYKRSSNDSLVYYHRIHNDNISEIFKHKESYIPPNLSFSNKKASICSNYIEKYEFFGICQQYDSNGKLLMNSTLKYADLVPLTLDNGLPQLFPYNLQDDGLIVLLVVNRTYSHVKVYRVYDGARKTLLGEIQSKINTGWEFIEKDTEICLKLFTTEHSGLKYEDFYRFVCMPKK